jgi:transposase
MAINTRNQWSKNSGIGFRNTRESHCRTVPDLVSKFRETGSVQDAPRSGRPSVLSQEKLDDISDRLLQSTPPPKKLLVKLAQQTELRSDSTHKAVNNELKLFPYKVLAVQHWKMQIIKRGWITVSGLKIVLLKTERTFWMWQSTSMKRGCTSHAMSTRQTRTCGVRKILTQLLSSLYTQTN